MTPELEKQFTLELARREFFYYCHTKAPDFYKENRKFLKEFCNDLQDFYESDDEVGIINLPPRHGKSRTAGLLVEWILGKNKEEKIMTGSYNETLSTMFSKNVRNNIQEEKADDQIERLQQSIATTENFISIIDDSVNKLTDEPYYEIIRLKYFEKKTREEIAEHFDVDVRTITRNKNKLINRLKIDLFCDDVLLEMIN